MLLYVGQDPKTHEDICTGFMVLILTEPDNAHKHYRYIHNDNSNNNFAFSPPFTQFLGRYGM